MYANQVKESDRMSTVGFHRSCRRSARTQWLPMKFLPRHPVMLWDQGTLSTCAAQSAEAPPASWLGCPPSIQKCQNRGAWSGELRGDRFNVVQYEWEFLVNVYMACFRAESGPTCIVMKPCAEDPNKTKFIWLLNIDLKVLYMYVYICFLH